MYWRAQNHEYTHSKACHMHFCMFIYIFQLYVCLCLSSCVIHSPRTSLETALSHLTPPRTYTHKHTNLCAHACSLFTHTSYRYPTPKSTMTIVITCTISVCHRPIHIHTHVSLAYASFCAALLLLTFLLLWASVLRCRMCTIKPSGEGVTAVSRCSCACSIY